MPLRRSRRLSGHAAPPPCHVSTTPTTQTRTNTSGCTTVPSKPASSPAPWDDPDASTPRPANSPSLSLSSSTTECPTPAISSPAGPPTSGLSRTASRRPSPMTRSTSPSSPKRKSKSNPYPLPPRALNKALPPRHELTQAPVCLSKSNLTPALPQLRRSLRLPSPLAIAPRTLKEEKLQLQAALAISTAAIGAGGSVNDCPPPDLAQSPPSPRPVNDEQEGGAFSSVALAGAKKLPPSALTPPDQNQNKIH